MKNPMSVQRALQYVADHPHQMQDTIEVPVWELVGRTLFDIANKPDASIRGSLRRATIAQRMLLNRLVGTRRSGSHPAVRQNSRIEFHDLTSVEAKK